MSDLYLIGYTADLRYLVLDPDPTATSGRYWLAVDDEVLLTVDELRDLRREDGFDDPEPEVIVVEKPVEAVSAGDDGEPPGDTVDPLHADGAHVEGAYVDGAVADGAEADGAEAAGAQPERSDKARGAAVSATDASHAAEEAERAGADDGDDEVPPESELSPAEIQQLLRAGRSPPTVAERAGTDISWVERWLPPIIAEREQVISEARSATLERQRLGRSTQPLGDAVRTNLDDRSVDRDDVRWSTRRRKDGIWTVTVHYRSAGKARRVSWHFDRDDDRITPTSDLARDLGFTAPRRRRSR